MTTVVTQEDITLFGMLLRKEDRYPEEHILFVALCEKIGIKKELKKSRDYIVSLTDGKKMRIDAPYNMAIEVTALEEWGVDMDEFRKDPAREALFWAAYAKKVGDVKVTKTDLGIGKLTGKEPYAKMMKVPNGQKLTIKANRTVINCD